MKRIRGILVWALAAVVVMSLTSCGNVAGQRVDSGEIVVPEMSSEDLLVSSLEYLLLEDENENVTEADEQSSDEEEEPEAVEEIKDQEDHNADRQEADVQQKRLPKENEAVIYYGNAGSYDLNQEIIELNEKSAEELVDALARHNIVSLDTKVLSFEESEEDGGKILRLDLSKAVSEYLKTMSREAECIILSSVANTFLENYEADGVYLTVNGEPLTTKNAQYAEALQKCTPEQLLKELKAEDMPDEDKEKEAEDPDMEDADGADTGEAK